jgi:hypothetical protein
MSTTLTAPWVTHAAAVAMGPPIPGWTLLDR